MNDEQRNLKIGDKVDVDWGDCIKRNRTIACEPFQNTDKDWVVKLVESPLGIYKVSRMILLK